MQKIDDRPRLKYLNRYTDRHGNTRIYFRRPGASQEPLPGEEGSPEFMAAYRAALDASNIYEASLKAAPPPRPAQADEGTINELVARYYRSANFQTLGPITKSTYRNEIEKFRRKHGEKPVDLLDRRGVKALINAKADRPGAANKLLRTVRMLMRFAIEEDMRKDDPTALIKRLKVPGDGFIAWGEEHIAKFEKRHKEGTKARLALALLLYTAQRRGDVVRMGRKNLKDGRVCVTQRKTGTYLEIPAHPKLTKALLSAPVGPETFLVTEWGKAFTDAGFGNWFADRCREAGLGKGYNAHGLRKAAARRLAEAGCTTLEIMAITGHKNIAEVERYTRAASQIRLAGAAMARIA